MRSILLALALGRQTAALAAPKALAAPLLDTPVYSLSTLNDDGSSNMNILTYASPVGIRPERRWAISLYRGTRSHANFARRKRGVLQLLRADHAELTETLGGASGVDTDKARLCADLGFAWESSKFEEDVLPKCYALLSLEARGDPVDCGDHEVYICGVADSVVGFDAAHLSSKLLRSLGLVDDKGRAVVPAPDAPPKKKRPWARAAAAAALAALVTLVPRGGFAAAPEPVPWSKAACRTEQGALYSTRTCRRFGLEPDGRLKSCLPSENCVSSTAIKSPAQYDAPWSYAPTTSDPKAAFSALVAAVEAAPDLQVETVDSEARYIRATAESVIKGDLRGRAPGRDDLELVVSKDGLVFHRSSSRDSVFFFPPQNIYSVPLGDNGTNRGRLESLRKSLGWESTAARSEESEDDPRSYQSLSRTFGM